MRISRVFLLAALMMWPSPKARAQSTEIVRLPLAGLIGKIPKLGSITSSPLPPSNGTTTQAILGDGTPVEIRHVSWPPPLHVISMKLIAPGVGWALASRHLFWTTDNGANLKDITPPSNTFSDEHICDVFFLDTYHVWVLLAQGTKTGPKFDVVYSADAGATWSRMHVKRAEDYGNLSPEGRIAFSDSHHGWMVLNLNTSSAFHAGTLFLTSDGGRTWRDSPTDPSGQGPILPVTAEEGWMAGGGDDEDLHVTWDGAKTWQTVALPAPKEIDPSIYPTSDVPVFEDNKHGFVAVTYTGGHQSAAVLFATNDGGRSWTPDRILTNLEEAAPGERLPSAVADSTWITARITNRKPTVSAIGPGARLHATLDPASLQSGYFSVDQLSFGSATQGWIVVGDGDLLSTTDGGATWTDITPGRKSEALLPQHTEARHSMSVIAAKPAPVASAPTASFALSYSQSLGLDKGSVSSSIRMLEWWIYSPYYDVGFYPNGSVNRNHDPVLDSTWVAKWIITRSVLYGKRSYK